MDNDTTGLICVAFICVVPWFSIIFSNALCGLRNFLALRRNGIDSTGVVIRYALCRKKRVGKHKSRTVRYYKPVVQYTANGQALEGKSDNLRTKQPYEIGETVDLKYLADDPDYVAINLSAFYIAKKVASNAIALAVCVAGCVLLTTLDVSKLVRYGMPAIFFGLLIFQVIRVFSSEAEILDEKMAQKITSVGALAQIGLSLLLSGIVYLASL
ncbi:MAG: hypothetical protein LBT59_28980 [Clostridiales bacterium]|nr:hypothetical protein [Clostridiales bacterium]